MSIARSITITAATVVLAVGAAASPSLAKRAPAAPVPSYHHVITHKLPPSPAVPTRRASKTPPNPPAVTPSGERAQVGGDVTG